MYTGSFAIGLGPVFWLLISEIYPARIRGKLMSVATMANWGANFVVAISFLTLLNTISNAGTFFIMCGPQQLGRSTGPARSASASRVRKAPNGMTRSVAVPTTQRTTVEGAAAANASAAWARDQRLADPVCSGQRHAGMLRIVQGGRDLVQQGVLRRGNPSTRHRRILWRLTACG